MVCRQAIVGLVVGLLFCPPAVTAESSLPTLETVTKTWKHRFDSVKAVRFKIFLNYENYRRKQKDEPTPPRNLDFAFNDSDQEYLRTTGRVAFGTGFMPIDHVDVRKNGLVDQLFVGGVGIREADQFNLLLFRHVGDIHITALRLCLCSVASPSSSWDYNSMSPVEEFYFEGQDCLSVVEDSPNRLDKRRIVFDKTDDFRILLIEEGEQGVATRRGKSVRHAVFRYYYGSPNSDSRFAFIPDRYTIGSFTPKGAIAAGSECTIQEVTFDQSVSPSLFELPIPPGSIVVDERSGPDVKSYVQLADGSRRLLAEGEDTPQGFLKLSSTIKGSRVEGKFALPTSTPVGWLPIVAMNLAVGAGIWIICSWLKTSLS